MKNDKWIEDAFKEAQPLVDNKTIEQFTDHIDKLFADLFPFVMTAFEKTYGQAVAIGFGLDMIKNPNLFSLLKAFFLSGYKAKVEELEKERDGGTLPDMGDV